MSPTLMMSGLRSRSRIRSNHSRSDASAEPPGESIRSTTARTELSSASARSCFIVGRATMPPPPPSGPCERSIEMEPAARSTATLPRPDSFTGPTRRAPESPRTSPTRPPDPPLALVCGPNTTSLLPAPSRSRSARCASTAYPTSSISPAARASGAA
jgi:hypothetical protein